MTTLHIYYNATCNWLELGRSLCCIRFAHIPSRVNYPHTYFYLRWMVTENNPNCLCIPAIDWTTAELSVHPVAHQYSFLSHSNTSGNYHHKYCYSISIVLTTSPWTDDWLLSDMQLIGTRQISLLYSLRSHTNTSNSFDINSDSRTTPSKGSNCYSFNHCNVVPMIERSATSARILFLSLTVRIDVRLLCPSWSHTAPIVRRSTHTSTILSRMLLPSSYHTHIHTTPSHTCAVSPIQLPIHSDSRTTPSKGSNCHSFNHRTVVPIIEQSATSARILFLSLTVRIDVLLNSSKCLPQPVLTLCWTARLQLFSVSLVKGLN